MSYWGILPRRGILPHVTLYQEILGLMLKPLVPKFRPDLSVRLKDIAEKRSTQS